jgi:hypothetical protein
MFVLLYAAIEVTALVLYRIQMGRRFSFSAVQGRAREVAAGKQEPRDRGARTMPSWLRSLVVHPYLGFVVDPTRTQQVGSYGFHSHEAVLQPRRADTYVVGVFGGSVATGAGNLGRLAIVRELERSRALAGRSIKIVCLALGGYKQPQQLQTLSLMLALGGHFDAVLNLDGFNDLVLPLHENVRDGTALYYPRAWPQITADLESKEFLLALGRRAAIGEERTAAARALIGTLARFNVAANVAWTFLDQWQQKRAEVATRALEKAAAGQHSYLHNGPQDRAASLEEAIARSTELWIESSTQMNHLAQANGIAYAHFLQPNQYLEGSKPLSDEEKRVAIRDGGYAPVARRVYPVLVKAGARLLERGVPFTDLTRIFENEKKTLYVDACCHVNQEGYERIGAAMGATLRERLDSAGR